MRQQNILGLTGGLAAGKSTVSSFFKALGAHIIDVDNIIHQLQQKDTPQTTHIAAELGPHILTEEGAIDRKKLSKLIEEQPEHLTFLEEVLHPAARKKILQGIDAAHNNTLTIIDAPLLFENGLHKLCTFSAYCYAPIDVRQKRAFARPGMTQQKWDLLLKKRWEDAKALRTADFILHTDLPLTYTKKQVTHLYSRLYTPI